MCFFFFKQKTAYEMRISDWSSDVCSSDLGWREFVTEQPPGANLRTFEPVETRLARIHVPINQTIRRIDNGAVGRQEAIGWRAVFILDACQQRQRGAGSEIKGKAGSQVIAFHVGAILHAVFAARLRHDTVIGCAGFFGYSRSE